MEIIFEDAGKKQIYRYERLASEMAVKEAFYLNTVTTAALLSSEEDSNAAGLFQYEKDQDGIWLKWLYVKPEYRKKGVGTAIIDYLKAAPSDSGKTQVSVRLYDHMMKDSETGEVTKFFQKNGFVQQQSGNEMICISGKDLFLRKPKPAEENGFMSGKSIISFEQCSPGVLVKAAQRFGMEEKYHVLKADKAGSFLCESSGECKGLLISEKVGRTLYLKAILAEDEYVKNALTMVFLFTRMNKMKFCEKIVAKGNIFDMEFLNRLMPEIKTEKEILLKSL